MKRCTALLILLVMSLAACSDDDSPAQLSEEPADPGDNTVVAPPPSNGWTRVQSRSDLSGLRVAPIEEISWNDDGTVALVRYLSGAEPCSGSTVSVEETPTTVTFTLETGLTPEAAVSACVAAIFNYEIAVPLAAPLGDRTVVRALGESSGDGDAGPPADPLDGAVFLTDQYLGLTEAEAFELADVEQRPIRIVSADGEYFPVTEDFSPGRVNIELLDGIVANAFGG